MPMTLLRGILSKLTGRAVNNEIFRNSQSGGVVTALLDYLMATHQVRFDCSKWKKVILPGGQSLLRTAMN